MQKIYDYNVREEIFGASVLDLQTGERYFINNDELNQLLEYNILPLDINSNKNDFKIKFIPLKEKNINHFSFADICYLEVTRACNLNCIHCLNNSGKKLDDQLTYDELLDLIKRFSENGIQEIRFTGGEPLVYEHIHDLIKTATELGIYTSIGTNGTLINQNMAKKLKDSGLKKAVVSIDGTKEKHDLIRGDGNFDKTIKGIENLEKLGIVTRINSVIMKTNMDDIIILAKQLHNNKKNLMIRRFIESGRGENLVDNVLSINDYKYVKEELKKELESANYINGHYLREKTEKISDRIKIPIDISDGCKAGKRALIITPEGNIHLCGFLAAQNFPPAGNVRNVRNWKDFWHKTNELDSLYELREKLGVYNKIPNIQPTNCLAYVQNYINRKKI